LFHLTSKTGYVHREAADDRLDCCKLYANSSWHLKQTICIVYLCGHLFLNTLRGYDTVDGRCTFGVVFPVLKGRQLRIHFSNSEWSFSTKRVSVTQITTAQIEIKWDLITRT